MNTFEILLNSRFKKIQENVFVRGNKKVKFFMLSESGQYQMMAVSSTDRSFPKIEYEIPDTEEDFIRCVENNNFHINGEFLVRAKLLSKDDDIYVEVSDKNGISSTVMVKSYRHHFDTILPQQYFLMQFKLASSFIRNKYITQIEVTDVITD